MRYSWRSEPQIPWDVVVSVVVDSMKEIRCGLTAPFNVYYEFSCFRLWFVDFFHANVMVIVEASCFHIDESGFVGVHYSILRPSRHRDGLTYMSTIMQDMSDRSIPRCESYATSANLYPTILEG